MSTFYGERKSSLIVTDAVHSNLKFLYSILDENDNSLMSISSSQPEPILSRQIQVIDVKRYFPQIRTLLQNTNDPFKCVGMYSRLLQTKTNDSLYSDPIFSQTFFHARIHPLLTAYLEKQTPYYRMKFQTQKILDVFYKYIFCEHGELMETNLRDGLVSNIGKWLFEEGLQKMFRKYYSNTNEFTHFVSEFMLHGLAAIFLAAVTILSKRSYKSQVCEIELIDVAYLKKYGLK